MSIHKILGAIFSPLAIFTLIILIPILLMVHIPDQMWDRITITSGLLIQLNIIVVIVIGVIGFIIASLYVGVRLTNEDIPEDIFFVHFLALIIITLGFLVFALITNSGLIFGIVYCIILYRSGLDFAKTFDISSGLSQYEAVSHQSKENSSKIFNIPSGIFGFSVMGSHFLELDVTALHLDLPDLELPINLIKIAFPEEILNYFPEIISIGNILVFFSLFYVGLKVALFGSSGLLKPGTNILNFLGMSMIYLLLVYFNIIFILIMLGDADLQSYLTIVSLILWAIGYIVHLIGIFVIDD